MNVSKSGKMVDEEGIDEYSEIHHLMSQKPKTDIFTKAFKSLFS
jgi:hypothetical protein